MSTYVIGDIHGCYDEFQRMLKLIELQDRDTAILVGDYIDRGKQSYEMLKFIENCPDNIVMIRGNHEEEFASCIDLMSAADRTNELKTDMESTEDAYALYETTGYWLRKKNPESAMYFDLYGTIMNLITDNGANFLELTKCTELIRKMPYCHQFDHNGRPYVVVHAGFSTDIDKDELAEFCLYAREEGIKEGGLKGGTVIAGHTPTVLKGEFAYTGGKIFIYKDERKDCCFMDIDCGCAYRQKYPEARLACIRIEDEKCFYV